ncbi:MAG: MFS transporter [Dehalococcoidia bacterium]|jgi:MFS family permease|nr:MFS transporter [Dehalococcoidia bacterium]
MLSRWYAATFEALTIPSFRILWGGSTFALLAFMMTRTVQSVVAFDLAGSSTAVGVVALGSGISMVFVGPIGGVFADRLSKRRVLLTGQSLIGFLFLVIGLLIVSDQLTIGLLVGLTFLMGLCFAFIGPTRQAYVGELVPRELLPNAVALSQLSMAFARVASPLVAGVLIAWSFSGTGGTYLFMSSLFLLVVATLFRLPASEPSSSGKSVFGDLGAGLSHVRERPRLMLLVGSFILVTIVGQPFVTVLPALLEHELGQPTERIGLLFTVEAVGGLATGLAIAGMMRGAGAWRLMLSMGVLSGVSMIALAVAPSFVTVLLAMFIVGVGYTGFQVTNNALLMMEADPAYFGRVMSLMMLAWGGQGLTALPIGVLADRIGEREVLAMEGVVIIVITVAAWVVYGAVVRRAERAALEVDSEAGGAGGG